MESVKNNFPFRQIRFYKYLTLEVLMHIEYLEACTFMFSANNQGRKFLQEKFKLIRNGFINNGLITYDFEVGFNGYSLLEKLYLEA